MRENEENARQILLCIATYARLHGFPPSLLELCMMCGIRLTAVRSSLRKLAEENWITYDASKAQCIAIKNERPGMNGQRYAMMECG